MIPKYGSMWNTTCKESFVVLPTTYQYFPERLGHGDRFVVVLLVDGPQQEKYLEINKCYITNT